jgi:hypothetical protein
MAARTERKSNRLLGALPEDVGARWRSHAASASMLERAAIEELACRWQVVVGEHDHGRLPNGTAARP